jgi:hypothetical protein
MDTHILFLGAGCSVPLGFPATPELASKFESSIDIRDRTKKGKLHDLINHSRKSAKRNGFNVAKQNIINNNYSFDVENLLEYFQGYSNPYYFIKRKGAFASSLSKTQPISKLTKNQIYHELKLDLEEHLIKNCFKEGPDTKQIIKLFYDRLFSKISSATSWQTSIPDWSNNTFEIFTTNFDNSLDTYSVESDIESTRGIKIDKNKVVSFEPEQFDDPLYRIKIMKIHGSVELSKFDDDVIISDSPPPLPGKNIEGRTIKSKVMVYGIEKDLTLEPYFELLSKLKKSLKKSSKCTVVGYSFRDEWIKNAFEEALHGKNPGDFTIDFIDPHATKTANSLTKLKPFFNSIDTTSEEFLEIDT